MKRKSIIICSIVVLLLVIGAVCWYLFSRSNGARSVIPADATAVAVLDPTELAKECDLSAKDMLELLNSKDGALSSVDFTKSMYMFSSPKGFFGLSANVSDADELKDALESDGASVQKQRGLYWYSADTYLLCFDSDKLLLVGPASVTEQEGLRNDVAELMKQSKQDVPAMAELDNMNGFLKMTSSAEIIPSAYRHFLTDYLSKNIPLDEVKANISLQVKEKSVAMNLSLTSDNTKIQETFEQLNKMSSSIKGNLLNLQPENPVLSINANLKGDQLLELLRKNDKLRTKLLALNMCVDADMMIRAIDGDVNLSLQKFDLTDPDFLLTAELTNTDFLSNVNDWKSGVTTDAGVKFSVLKDNDFMLNYDGSVLYFGVRQNKLYITSDENMANIACQPSTQQTFVNLKDDMKDCQTFASIDLAQVLHQFATYALMLGAEPSLYEAVDAIDRINLKMRDSQHTTLELTSKKNIADIIKEISKK